MVDPVQMSLPEELGALAKLMDDPQPRVVIVVGAGVSIGATGAAQASWFGLLNHGIDHLVHTDQFTLRRGGRLKTDLESAFSPFKLDDALRHAENIEQSLNVLDPDDFQAWLSSAFAGLSPAPGKAETLEALRDLETAGVLLLTTNYDSLLADVTGLSPVTWEEKDDFYRVMDRQVRGILHVHGHWQRSRSVILGKGSYERIKKDRNFQDLLKALWLGNTWAYVGCGDGLDDPNLGKLLEWSRHWEKSARPDYFFARGETTISSRKPKNLVYYGYADHDVDLPNILLSLEPGARAWPFTPLDENFRLFRAEGASTPVPSYKEYLEGRVPAFSPDEEVVQRLDQFGWCFVEGPAASGKTTLALRLAARPERRGNPAYYLDLGEHDVESQGALAAVTRLSRRGTLLILDNVHRLPEFANALWDLWRNLRREDSRLILLATRVDMEDMIPPQEDLTRLTSHRDNPAIPFKPSSKDFGAIAYQLYYRVSGGRELPAPPPEVLEQWQQTFGGQLHAFCPAVLQSLHEFQRGNWSLSMDAAFIWVRKYWLEKLDTGSLANALCLSAFGAQDLELAVGKDALPNPDSLEQLQKLGLSAKTTHGVFGQYQRFSLVEPGWGTLILRAHSPSVDPEKILFDTATRHPMMALLLSMRLRRIGQTERRERLWAVVAANPGQLVSQIFEVDLSWSRKLLLEARPSHPELARRLWKAIEAEPDKLAARAWETPLGDLASFLDTAKRHERDVGPLWDAIEAEPDKLAARAWETPLHFVASFLDTAKRHKRAVGPLWDAIEAEPDKLVARAWETPLDHLASFLDTAKRHERAVGPLWEAIEAEPDKLANTQWTALSGVAAWFSVVHRTGRDLQVYVQPFCQHSRKLSNLAKSSGMTHLAGFVHSVPDELIKIAFTDLTATQWDNTSASDRFVGAAWVAKKCKEIERDDLATALVMLLLRRANRRDFPPRQSMSLFLIAWLLKNVSPKERSMVPAFIDSVCTSSWLGSHYTNVEMCGALAAGLYTLGLSQPPDVCMRFHNSSLGIRLNREFQRFDGVAPDQQSDSVRLLGVASLCGWRVGASALTSVSPAFVGALPETTLPHRMESDAIEDWQYQLWLGLRTFASILRQPLSVRREVIEDTLERWMRCLEQSAAEPTSASHHVDQSMTAWLETCLNHDPPRLIPEPERLWELIGFPRHVS